MIHRVGASSKELRTRGRLRKKHGRSWRRQLPPWAWKALDSPATMGAGASRIANRIRWSYIAVIAVSSYTASIPQSDSGRCI